MPRKICSAWSPYVFERRCATETSTKTKKPIATDEFLMRAITTLMSGGSTLRNACGSTTRPIVWLKVRPIEREASAWPIGTELMPERTASAKNALV